MLSQEQLYEIMEKISEEMSKPFKSGEHLKEKVINNALTGYAKGCNREDVIGIYDTTILGSGKTGFLLAKDAFCSDLFVRYPGENSGYSRLPIQGMCGTEKCGRRDMFLTVHYQDGDQLVIYIGNIYDILICKILNSIIALNNEEAELIARKISEKSALQLAEEGDPASQFIMGNDCEHGYNMPIDRAKALFWYVCCETNDSYMEDICNGATIKLSIKRLLGQTNALTFFMPRPEGTILPEELYQAVQMMKESSLLLHQDRIKYYLRAAARMGYSLAQYEYAIDLWEEGHIVLAYNYCIRAAEHGNDDANRLLENITKELKKEERDFETDALYLVCLGEDAYQKEKYAQALEYFVEAAKLGSAHAMVRISGMYLMGEGVERNLQEARWWAEAMLEAGDKKEDFSEWPKMVSGAIAYEEGRKLYVEAYCHETYYAKAFPYIKEAAEEHYYSAIFWLGLMYRNGWGTEKNQMLAKECFSRLKVGNKIEFGRYRQKDYKDPIRWIILEKKGNRLLLLSEKILFARQYSSFTDLIDDFCTGESSESEFDFMVEYKEIDEHSKEIRILEEGVTWETCKLREYLNGQFLFGFCSEEENIICKEKIYTPNNPDYSTDGGCNTVDQVFLLSIQEVFQYFTQEGKEPAKITVPESDTVYYILDKDYSFIIRSGVLAKPTEYAQFYNMRHNIKLPLEKELIEEFVKCHMKFPRENEAIDINEKLGTSSWWLRSPGNVQYTVSVVTDIGVVNIKGEIAAKDRIGVRPAMWINLD